MPKLKLKKIVKFEVEIIYTGMCIHFVQFHHFSLK